MTQVVSSIVDVERHDAVAVVRFNRPEGFNSFDAAIMKELREVFTALMADDSVRALVLTGTGKAFATGADVRQFHAEIQAHGSATQWTLAATEQLHPLLLDIHGSDKPLIAAVNGVAAGGGLGLALVADYRIGTAAARFASGYFGLGTSPDGGATWLLPRLIGVQRTKRFFFENEVMGAETALETGLMDELVEGEDLLGVAIEVARRWGSWAKHSRESTKRLLEMQAHNSFTAQMDAERGLIAAGTATADFAEGVSAFVEKRRPSFA